MKCQDGGGMIWWQGQYVRRGGCDKEATNVVTPTPEWAAHLLEVQRKPRMVCSYHLGKYNPKCYVKERIAK